MSCEPQVLCFLYLLEKPALAGGEAEKGDEQRRGEEVEKKGCVYSRDIKAARENDGPSALRPNVRILGAAVPYQSRSAWPRVGDCSH